MGNPLNKRLPREMKRDLPKYIVIFLLMVLMIGEVSGFVVADGSMIKAYNESFEKYNMENGHFSVQNRLNKSKKKDIESLGVELFDQFYVQYQLTSNESKLRIFPIRQQVNLPCIMDGRLPENIGEIAIDRMYADNNGILTGDVISREGEDYTVTGLIALPDFSTMFENNSDTMFDAKMFGVAVVCQEEFNGYEAKNITYNYTFRYQAQPADETEERDLSEDFLKGLSKVVKLEDYLPAFYNQAIKFTGDDMGSDNVMIQIFLYVVIVILAFVFSVTISNTIAQESEVIGTLRASGYTKGELISHYMFPPLIVTLISALIGNILGYTVFKDLNASLYYASYSLPTYVTIWSADAFLKTTLIPVGIMAVVTFFSLYRKLSFSPLEFLRRDLSRRKKSRAMRLPAILPFFSRYRLRIIFQNRSSYIVLFMGIFFSYFLLLFGLLFPRILKDYQANVSDNMLSNYQYILTVPVTAVDDDNKLLSMLYMMQFVRDVETENETAEKFTAYSLQIDGPENVMQEDATIYGIAKNSRYIPLDINAGDVYISRSFAEKFMLGEGDELKMSEEFEDKSYTFTITGVFDYMGGICVFLDQSDMNRIFDLGNDYFSGYFSETEITDIDEKYIGSVIDYEAMTKISRQLLISMGDMMNIVVWISIVIAVVLIYLLSKLIIEKNAGAISMAKILGYHNMEVSRLYVFATTAFVFFSLLALLPLENYLMVEVFHIAVRMEMHGWFDIYVPLSINVEMFVLLFASYFVVMLLEMRRIRRIPMDEALKSDD